MEYCDGTKYSTTARKNLEWLSPFITEHLEPDIWDSLHTISYYFSKNQGFLSLNSVKKWIFRKKLRLEQPYNI
jgi:hypothetical protein